MDEITNKQETAGKIEPAGKESEPVEGPIQITERDMQIFKLIHEQRYVLHSHIRNAFWYDRSEEANACHHRKVKLIQAGYLAERYSKALSIHCYAITEKAHEALKVRGLDSGMPHFKFRDGFDKQITHDVRLTTIRVLLGRLGLTDWTGERLMKCRNYIRPVPDGFLMVNGHKVAVEFENYLTKGLSRYVDLFNDYKRTDYFLILVIVYGDVKEWLQLLPNYDAAQVWFASYKDFTRCKKNTRFVNRRSDFTLRELIS